MATLTMKAQVTNKYTLYIDQVTKPPADNPWAREVPGTWVWWLLDEHGKFLSSPTYEVGFGPYNETYKHEAYDEAVTFLAHHDSEEQRFPFDKVQWEPSPTPLPS